MDDTKTLTEMATRALRAAETALAEVFPDGHYSRADVVLLAGALMERVSLSYVSVPGASPPATAFGPTEVQSGTLPRLRSGDLPT